MDKDIIRGMGKQLDQFIMILDIDKIFSAGDMEMARELDSAMASNG